MIDGPAGAGAFERQRAAMAVTGVTAPEKAVLLVLAIMANGDGIAWPSITQIAARASIGRRTAFEALDRLAASGLIVRDPVPGKGARYTLLSNWCASRTGAPVALVREPHSTGAPAAPKQPRTPKVKKTSSSQPTRAIEIMPELPLSVTDRQWSDFADMRVAMSKGTKPRPWSPAIARKAIEKLHRLAADGHDPGAALDESVLNGWQGLFPEKEITNGHRTSSGRRSFDGGVGAAVRTAFDRVPVD